MVHEFFPKFTESDFGSHPRRMLSVSYVLFGPFHGGNTGSNPVGDAKLELSASKAANILKNEIL